MALAALLATLVVAPRPALAATYTENFDTGQGMGGVFVENGNEALRPLWWDTIQFGEEDWCQGCTGIMRSQGDPVRDAFIGIVPGNVSEITIVHAGGTSGTSTGSLPRCRLLIGPAWVNPDTGEVGATAPDSSYSPEFEPHITDLSGTGWRPSNGMHYRTYTTPVVPYRPMVLRIMHYGEQSTATGGEWFCGIDSISGLEDNPENHDTTHYGGGALVGGGSAGGPTEYCPNPSDPEVVCYDEGSLPSGSEGFGDCVPSGWNLANPFAYVGGIGCVLSRAFIPSTDMGEVADDIKASGEGRVPFNWLAEIGSIPGALNSAYTADTDCFYGGFTNYDLPGGGGSHVDLGDSSELAGSGRCNAEETPGSRNTVRNIFTVIVWVCVAARIWTTAPWNKGQDAGVATI